jgi:hypothetical protein
MGIMIKVLTRSGAEYLIDDDLGEVCRLNGPWSPGINYKTHPDGLWNRFTGRSAVRLGQSIWFSSPVWNRVTTPVVNTEFIESTVGDAIYAESIPPEVVERALKTVLEGG